MAGETIEFGTTDIGAVAHIPLDAWAEILKGGPTEGDLIEYDFTAGAEWVPGEAATYSIVVPVVMKATDPETAWGDAMDLMALRGVERTLSRTYTTDLGSQTDTCQAVITADISPVWGPRSLLTLPLVFQILTEWA